MTIWIGGNFHLFLPGDENRLTLHDNQLPHDDVRIRDQSIDEYVCSPLICVRENERWTRSVSRMKIFIISV